MSLSQDQHQGERQDEVLQGRKRSSSWLKWAGIGTFSFFLIKGLIWLGLGAAGLAALWANADHW